MRIYWWENWTPEPSDIVPVGSEQELQQIINDITDSLSDILSADRKSVLKDKVKEYLNAKNQLATVTRERDALKPWGDNKDAFLKLINIRKNDIKKLLSSANDASKQTSYRAEIAELDKLLGQVTGVKPKKVVADWKTVLEEINNFFINQKPTTLQAIQDFLDDENYPDPLEGVSLDGKTANELRTNLAGKEDNQVETELPKAKDYALKYQNYVPFQSSKDGNCFLNSFSILLNGDEALATRLRVKLCLELMAGKYVDGNEIDKVKEITEKLTTRVVDSQNCALAKSGAWLAGDDIAYMCGIISRPITLIYRPDTSGWDQTKDAYREVEKTGGFAIVEYPAKENNPFGKPTISGIITKKAPEYVIYHVGGNHFVPLVSKN